MNYRLPLLFSSICFIILWVVESLLLMNFFPTIPDISQYIFLGIQQITFFFFFLLLSCIFFNNQKLYLLTTKNYQQTIVLAIVFSVIFCLTKFLIYEFLLEIISPMLWEYMPKLSSELDINAYKTLAILVDFFVMPQLYTITWILPISGLILYGLTLLNKRYFDIPAIANSQPFQSQQIVNQNTANPKIGKALPKLYGMIFSALFCAVTHGITWYLYGTCFFYIPEVEIYFAEYININILSGLVIILADFTLLYITTQNSVKRIYQWLPTGSLLSAGAFTIVVFILLNTIILIVLSIFIAISHSLSSFMCWFIVLRYIALYLISRFFLKRSFG
ncbi:hypothetical protein JMI89_00090 [Frischella sp. Ac48]|uniref:hypothetical protein n=1 Tax=Frischella sp. Ac48 TaxID=2804531 RepID=UPI001C7CCAA7|nr:hypothetical protein [Frischella sp. Ac48]MBX4132031.1 hypothetical protein [Frischella sp. Ac48]